MTCVCHVKACWDVVCDDVASHTIIHNVQRRLYMKHAALQ